MEELSSQQIRTPNQPLAHDAVEQTGRTQNRLRLERVQNHVDFDIHGLVGIRLVNPSAGDAAAVTAQLGPFRRQLFREPDVIVRFVDNLSTPDLRSLGPDQHGFTDDGYFILQSSKQRAKVKLPFDQIGKQCEIVCETGLRSVPLLLAIVNLTALNRDYVSLHASAFLYEGSGILVTGWARGGKTEALLAFAQEGATYIGDEWILLSGDGERMYGVPEHIRLWDWHLDSLPHIRRRMAFDQKLLFAGIHWLEGIQRLIPEGRIGTSFPARFLGDAMPALRRQLNLQINPQTVFTKFGPFEGRPERVFLMVSGHNPDIHVGPCDALAIAWRMIESIRYEQLPFMAHYLAFKFAFPERKNDFIEQAHELQREILCRALEGKQAYVVRHPYPCSFRELFKAMRPYCSARGARAGATG